MFWIYTLGLICVSYAIYKLTLFLLSEKNITLSKGKRDFLLIVIAISVFTPAVIYQNRTRIKDGHHYFVNLFETENSSKNYRVPGLISVEDDGYKLLSVDWPNGGNTDFDYHLENPSLVIGKKELIQDNNDKKWFVELTKDEVK